MARVFISEAAIFTTTRNPRGSAGTAKWMDRLAINTKKIAEATAPVNHVDNALHRGGVVGTYKASFSWDRVGGNRSYLRRTVRNSAPHAGIVEKGRRSTKYRGIVEKFTWVHSQIPGDLVIVLGTVGRNGNHTLELAQGRAWAASRFSAKVNVDFIDEVPGL